MYLEYFETTADDFMEDCHWDETLKQKMREPVAPNGKCNFDSRQTMRLIDLSWFENLRRPLEISIWDEAAKKKMRKPVLTNGHHHLSDEVISRLIKFGSLF
jgi:hypothetical protein